jgi:hypothetical protein
MDSTLFTVELDSSNEDEESETTESAETTEAE